MKETFFNHLEKTFSLEKLRNDLEEYIQYSNGHETTIIISHEITSKEESIIYTRKDPLTLISIKATKKYQGIIFIPYIIDIGIGEFKKYESNIFEVSKCTASMSYDEDFILASIDFTYF